MKLYDFFMLLENLEAFRTAKGVKYSITPLRMREFLMIGYVICSCKWTLTSLPNPLLRAPYVSNDIYCQIKKDIFLLF